MEKKYDLDLDKYKITKERNIILAKKYLATSIYRAAKIEGCNVTYPDTQTILAGAVVNNVSVDDIQTVLNLRDAYKFMLNTVDKPFSLEYVCKINEYVARNESLQWGILRTGNIGIGGTKWIPGIPDKAKVEEDINRIINILNPIDRALEYFSYAVRNQLFWDGNKRTSIIVANKILINNKCGILNITDDNLLEFNKTLLHFYDTDDNHPLRRCLKQSIFSIDKKMNLINYYSVEPGLIITTVDNYLHKKEHLSTIIKGIKKSVLDDMNSVEQKKVLKSIKNLAIER